MSGPELDRRSFLVGTAATAATGAALLAGCVPAPRPVQVYILVVDGCRPDEITPTSTPRLAALRADGTNFATARSLPLMETIPNHVMMATGVLPARNGVPANSVFDRVEGVVRELDRPTDLVGATILETVRQAGGTSVSALSKEYLYGIFGTRASFRWKPEPLLPLTDHAPDVATIDALLDLVDTHGPDLAFANLGDIDRFGHADLTGTTPLQAARRTALAATDIQIGRFVDYLRESGKWSDAVVVVLADHSMDWSTPGNFVSLTRSFSVDTSLAGRFVIAQNGGADLVSWTGPTTGRSAGLARMRELALATPGVRSVHSPAELALGPRAGDLVAYCHPGWRFTDPSTTSNPIPGNHGHPTTAPIPFFIGGGARAVNRGRSATATARTLDVAPTVAWLLGTPAPSGGFDGTALTAAFSSKPVPIG